MILSKPWTATRLKIRVKWCLKHAKNPKPNLTRQQKKAIQRFKEDHTIMILPADKGKATVVINTSEYENENERSIGR